MADNEVKFLLDLDIKDFTEQGLKAKGIIEKIGSEENLAGLIDGLTKTSALLGTVGAVAYSFKKAIDLTVEGEHLERVNQQFDRLTEQAGISSLTLKKGLEEASKGLISTNDLMEIANKSIVTMGTSAEKLPQVMELARKATAVFGGDLTSNFESISQAISTGNARMLKHYGIVIDTEKAVKEFAKTNGIAENAISEAGKRQAILNAALEQGQKNFAGVDVNINSAESSLKLLHVIMTDIGEIFTTVFEKKLGGPVKSALGYIRDLAETAKNQLAVSFSTGSEQAEAKVKLLEARIKETKQSLIDLQSVPFGKFFPAAQAERVGKVQKKLQELQGQLVSFKAENETLIEQEKRKQGIEGKSPKNDPKKDAANKAQLIQNAQKYEKEALAIEQNLLKANLQNVQKLGDVDKALSSKKILNEKTYAAQRKQIETAIYLDSTQKAQLLDQLDAQNKASEKQREEELKEIRKKAMENYVHNSKDAFEGIGRAAQQMSMQAQADMADFGERGKAVMQEFKQNSVAAFTQMGASIAQGKNIAEAAGEAIKSIFLNMLGDRAIAEGSLLLLSGIFPPNPLALGAGAGLIALGGALKSLAGGGGGAAVSTPSVGGGGSASYGGGISSGGGPVSTGPGPAKPTVVLAEDSKPKEQPPEAPSPIDEIQTVPTPQGNAIPTVPVNLPEEPGPSAEAMPGMEQSQRAQKSVHINIAGNYFETDTTRRQLMEMVRQETDATDFTYNKIGV